MCCIINYVTALIRDLVKGIFNYRINSKGCTEYSFKQKVKTNKKMLKIETQDNLFDGWQEPDNRQIKKAI